MAGNENTPTLITVSDLANIITAFTPAEDAAVYVLSQMSDEEDAALTWYLDGRSSD